MTPRAKCRTQCHQFGYCADLAASAKSAYVDGMGVGVLVAAAARRSLVALAFLPSRARMESEAPSEHADGPEVDLEVPVA